MSSVTRTSVQRIAVLALAAAAFASTHASVAHPLDDGSFIYAVRTAGIRVGETRSDDRYFRPDRNPVVLTGLRREAVDVEAGVFPTTVVRPTIKTNGIFSEHGEAQI